MFTGIIKKTARIESVERRGGKTVIFVRCSSRVEVTDGQHVSVNGISSTLSTRKGKVIFFEYGSETMKKTTLRFWKKDDLVNLEENLKFGHPINGHLVTGHVDGVGQVTAGVNDKGERLFKIETSKELIAHMTKKGSIAVDGVSLTLADVGENWFAITLIPYTISHTGWKERKVGDMVNLELNRLGKQRTRTMRGYVKKSSEKLRKNAKRA